MTGAPFDLRDYRHALGAFLTGVTVVTTLDRQGGPRGFTANSFTSVSLDPPLVLVCIDKRGRSFEVFAEGDGYAVNILSESQQAVSSAFATPTGDRFARVAWHAGPAGHPVFEGAAAWLDCRRHDLVDAGDHVIMIGRVVGYHHTVRPPLGYSRGTYVSASLEREAIARTGYATEIVAILEHDEAILLVGDDDAPLGLPHAEHIGDTGDTGSLLGLLDAAGFDAELGFVFSVVDNAETGRIRIVYRGTAEARADSDASFRFHSLRDIPWPRLYAPETATVLRRYVTERVQHRFGVYVGGAETGQIASLSSELAPLSNEDIDAGYRDAESGSDE